MVLKYKKHAVVFILLGFALSFLLVEATEILSRNNNKIMTVSFLDVGQGDALLITTPNYNQIMIDTSLNEIVLTRLNNKMSYFDKTIDLIISTHPHADHIGGLPSIIENYSLKTHGFDFGNHRNNLVDRIYDLTNTHKINTIILEAGDRIIIDEENNIYIDILWPTAQISINDLNDNSIVTHLVYNEISFLMTGDAGKRIENYLVSAFDKTIQSQVLKLGHHGSRTSTDYNFLKTVMPKYTVISAGENNQYGHPHQEVLDTLEKYKLNYPEYICKLNSNICGTKLSEEWVKDTFSGSVIFETNGKDLWLVK